MPKLCHARELDLRVGYRVVVETGIGELVGRVDRTPRRREPYATPYEILRVATPEDEREEHENRERGREVCVEAGKLARDHRVGKVLFIGCDVSLDGGYFELKYEADGDRDLRRVGAELERLYDAEVVFRRFTFIERAGDVGGCDTCGVPLCCATWSGARSLGPINVRQAKQQGVTPNDKILGSCGEIKCCMRYEHEAYKEFKERAPFKNTLVKLGDREGKVADYSMVRDSVFVGFGERRSDRELIPLGELARHNPGIEPADPAEWEPEDEAQEPPEPQAGDGEPEG